MTWRTTKRSAKRAIVAVGIIDVNVDECNCGCDDDTTISADIYIYHARNKPDS